MVKKVLVVLLSTSFCFGMGTEPEAASSQTSTKPTTPPHSPRVQRPPSPVIAQPQSKEEILAATSQPQNSMADLQRKLKVSELKADEQENEKQEEKLERSQSPIISPVSRTSSADNVKSTLPQGHTRSQSIDGATQTQPSSSPANAQSATSTQAQVSSASSVGAQASPNNAAGTQGGTSTAEQKTDAPPVNQAAQQSQSGQNPTTPPAGTENQNTNTQKSQQNQEQQISKKRSSFYWGLLGATGVTGMILFILRDLRAAQIAKAKQIQAEQARLAQAA